MSDVAAPRLRRRVVARTVDGVFGSLSMVGRLHPRSKPEKHGVERVRNIPYIDDGRPEHLLDVWRPEEPSATLRPAVLYIHGGAFQSLSKESHWLMALAYAQRGFVVFNINYRLAPTHPFPAALQDSCAAAVWVRENARLWGADPDRIVFGGESAGGNLVVSLALCTSWRRDEDWAASVWDSGLRPAAVAASYGVYQVSDSGRFGRRKRLPWFIDARLKDVEDCYLPSRLGGSELADPLLVLESDRAPEHPLPPFFLPVGTADPLLDDTRRMADALRRRGVHHEARYYKGEPHAFDTLIWRKRARQCWIDRFAFLDGVLGS